MSDAEIRQILMERIDQKKQGVGIVVGVLEDRGERVISYGTLNQGDARALSGDTVFELGSVTSVFTALLLADMTQRGEVLLNDPVAKYLPANVHVPQYGGKSITLTDLATHTAGLPLLPANFHPKNPANPYADYTEQDLFDFLNGFRLAGETGAEYQFSNIGSGLLALALSRRAGTSYDTLLRTRILEPLGMKNSGIVPSAEMKLNFATGHNAQLQATPYWDAPALGGAVGLKSTAYDLLSFLGANMGYRRTTLAPALAAMLVVRRPTRHAGLELALGWHVLTTSKAEIVWHNGGTGGFRAFLGFDPRAKIGIVVLSNTETTSGIDDIGLRLFDTEPPAVSSAKEHKEVKVDQALFNNYVGQYQINEELLLTISRDGDHLVAQLGQQKFPLVAESNKDFFVKTIDGQLTFVTDRQGVAYMVIMHQAGTDIPAKRIR